MDNAAALNETNSTLPPINDISFFQKLFSGAQEMVSDKLISWEIIPEDLYFRVLVIIITACLAFLLIIKFSNMLSGGVKIVVAVILALLILVVAGVL